MDGYDYRELPEPVAAAFANLLGAHKLAHQSVPQCPRCGHVSTMRVQTAEAELLAAMRQAYTPPSLRLAMNG